MRGCVGYLFVKLPCNPAAARLLAPFRSRFRFPRIGDNLIKNSSFVWGTFQLPKFCRFMTYTLRAKNTPPEICFRKPNAVWQLWWWWLMMLNTKPRHIWKLTCAVHQKVCTAFMTSPDQELPAPDAICMKATYFE